MSYKDLKSYQNSLIIYDLTVEFCKKYVDFKSRTTDQMVQAARSGKQNIVEGVSERSATSELKLLGVARASLEELLEDYTDFLRQKGLAHWSKDDPQAIEVRNLYKLDRTDGTSKSDRTDQSNKSDKSDKSDQPNRTDDADKTYRTDSTDTTDRIYKIYMSYLDNPEKAANAAICLIHQTNFLLDRQIKSLEGQFVKKGCYTEGLKHKREEEKKRIIVRNFNSRYWS